MNRPSLPGPRPVQPDLEALFQQAMTAHRAGQLDIAAKLYRQVLSFSKKQFAPRHMLGVIEGQRGNFAEGIRQIGKALKINPDSSDAYLNMGRMQAELGDLAAADKSLRKAIFIDPANVIAHANLAAALTRTERYDEALASAERALTIDPNNTLALFNRARALFHLGHYDEAITTNRQILAIDRTDGDAWLNLGNIYAQIRRYADAFEAYKAASVTPSLPKLSYAIGELLVALNRNEEALTALDRELSLQPDFAPAWFARGEALNGLRRFDEAVAAFDTALRHDPATPRAAALRLNAKAAICDWSTFAADQADVQSLVRKNRFSAPQLLLSRLPLSSQQQLEITRRMAARTFAGIVPQPVVPARSDRIRIAYVSGDLGNHAVAELIAGVFEHHDRSRFDLTAVSLIKHDGPMRERLVKAFDRFIDASGFDDRQSVRTIRDLGIDIAVDLNGYTQSGRMQIFAHRVAPVQVNYLGYPGTSGTDFMDYLLADRTVIPPEDERFYSEAIATLPDSFMPADSRREIGSGAMTRREAGLPDHGFVFCDFNDSTKLTPDVFSVWMSLLRQVEGSVLWLRAYNPTAVANLRREAKQRGVAPERLVFAPSTPLVADHLARQRLADLFLDTLPYNAHATASDALWAGLPVVTCVGAAFAGRVAASQIRAAGLPDLVTHSLAEYEALALKIAREPDLLKALKARLTGDPAALALFDTARLTRHLEAAYTTMWERACSGLPPAPFAVAPLPR